MARTEDLLTSEDPSPEAWRQIARDLPAAVVDWMREGLTAHLLAVPPKLPQDLRAAFGAAAAQAIVTLSAAQTRRRSLPRRTLVRLLRLPGLAPDERSRQLAWFHVLDAARRLGQLEVVLQAATSCASAVAADLTRFAHVQPDAPILLGHRGNPVQEPENSLQSFASAFAAGAEGVEIDLVLVGDGAGGHDVLAYHDGEPGNLTASGFYALCRNLGLERFIYAADDFRARPSTPFLWRRGHRRPTHELDVDTFRAHYALTSIRDPLLWTRPFDVRIPTLDEVGAWLAANDHLDKVLFLDTKPPAQPALRVAMADIITGVVKKHRLRSSRIILGNGDREALATIKERVAATAPDLEFGYSLDEMLLGPWARAQDHSAQRRADEMGNGVADLGHVFLGSDEELLTVALREAASLRAAGRTFVLWTINDELVMRKLLGVGGIDMVITDRPAAMRRVLAVC